MLTTDVLLLIRIAIAIVFLFSLTQKVVAFRGFVKSVRDLSPFSPRFDSIVVVAAPLLEAGILLSLGLGGALLPIGLGVAVVLVIVYTLVLLRGIKQASNAECNCVYGQGNSVSTGGIIRNCVLLLTVGLGLAYALRHDSTAGALHDLPSALLVVLVGIGSGLLIVWLPVVIAIFTVSSRQADTRVR